jgi:hypothetical protein
MVGRWERWAPLTGILAVAIILIAFIAVGGSTPDTKDSAEKVFNFYKAHRNRQMTAGFVLMIGGAFLLLFAGCLRGLLARGSATRRLASISFGGGVLATGGFFLAATTHIALADSGKYGDPTVAHVLNILDGDDYVPFIGGIGLMVFAAGVSFVVTRAAPLWLGILSIIIGVLVFTPLGFFAVLAGALWIIGMSIWMAVRPVGAGGAVGSVETAPPLTT